MGRDEEDWFGSPIILGLTFVNEILEAPSNLRSSMNKRKKVTIQPLRHKQLKIGIGVLVAT
jgi:hypothetical protein